MGRFCQFLTELRTRHTIVTGYYHIMFLLLLSKDSLILYHTCPKTWTNPFYYLLMWLKTAVWFTNCVDSDQTLYSVDLSLYCLLRPLCERWGEDTGFFKVYCMCRLPWSGVDWAGWSPSTHFAYVHHNLFIKLASTGGSTECASNWWSGGCRFDPRRVQQHSFMEIDHEIFSTVILSLPLIQEGQLSVSSIRMCTSAG